MDYIINKSIIYIFPTASSVFQAVAEDFVNQANNSVKNQEFFSVILSGGETPIGFFKALVEFSQIKEIP